MVVHVCVWNLAFDCAWRFTKPLMALRVLETLANVFVVQDTGWLVSMQHMAVMPVESVLPWTSWAHQGWRFGLNCFNSNWRSSVFLEVLGLLRLLIVAIMQSKPGQLVATFGIVCSSWVVISRGTSGRSWIAPLGDTSQRFVREGNQMTSRWVFQMPLCVNECHG